MIGIRIELLFKYKTAAIHPFIKIGNIVIISIKPCIIVEMYELIKQLITIVTAFIPTS